MNKFYNFITNNDKSELYLYGAIVSEKWSEDDVDFKDFKNTIDELNNSSTLEIYINSPGGEVFVTQSIISLLKRAKATKNISIDCYIDGLGASCASWLPMIADNLYIYDGSMLMLHKPMSSLFFANVEEMKKEIELLDKIESQMIESYMLRAKETLTEEFLKDMLSKETWLNADEIEEYFNVTRLNSSKQLVACLDKEMLNKYKNIPKNLVDVKEYEKNIENKRRLLEIELALV
ncbi:head maturation protease, ClpP-related [Clostridium tertium]|uniref:head maturation protease, ClpP-related n=1 Tax=Clostridium tertium TaxID=1559 RepID=UPI0024B34748|nr:head maturation protease, ClpP-related [Clostridium tertium]MDI9216004.1 Clp protease ClpP [Clostridium tertium]